MTSDNQSAQAHSPQNRPDSTQPSISQGRAPSGLNGRSGRGDADRGCRGHDWIQTAVAICLIGLYISSLWVMFDHRNDRQWDRMVYLFSGYEAIVLVAVGAIFGTRIQRASVESATEHARQAHDELVSERRQSHGATGRAATASTLATAVKGYAARQAQDTRQDPAAANNHEKRAGARGVDTGQAPRTGASPIELDPGLAVLVDLADAVLTQRQWG